jgi:hypothetical protein
VTDRESAPPTGAQPLSARIDTTVAHSARRYDYWLGGKDNFAADRESGDAIAAVFPTVRTAVLENRRFLNRAVTFLAKEVGIRQFLDIGTGIPTANNTHQVAQSIAPESRVVYVDNDPIVLAHARALLTSTPEGATAYLDADLHDPGKILADPGLATLDLSQPVALMLLAVLHFITDEHDPHQIVRQLVGALPSGSYVVVSHSTSDDLPAEVIADIDAGRYGMLAMRPKAQIARFFDGLELVEPGIVPTVYWRAENEPQPRPLPIDVRMYAAVARVP